MTLRTFKLTIRAAAAYGALNFAMVMANDNGTEIVMANNNGTEIVIANNNGTEMVMANNNGTEMVMANNNGTGWVLGGPGMNCDEACVAQGGSCNAQATSQINTEERMRFVDAAFFGEKCDVLTQGQVFENEPAFYANAGRGYCIYLNVGDEVLCNIRFGGEQRFCCCGTDCPVEFQHDWILSAPGQDCNEGCSAVGGTCDPEPPNNIDSRGKAEFVSVLLGNICDDYTGGVVFKNEPSFYTYNGRGQCVHPLPGNKQTGCTGTFGSEQRMCCCGSSCPTLAEDVPGFISR